MNTDVEFSQPSSPAGAIAIFFAGVILLIAFLTAIIANWSAFVAQASGVSLFIIILAGVTICTGLTVFGGYRLFLVWMTIQHQREDLRFKQEERLRAQERHEMQLYLAESRLHADPNGNRPYIFNRESGQVLAIESGNYVQPVPTHYNPHFEITSSSTASQAQQEALEAAQQVYQQPPLETVIEELGVNALEFAYGLDPLTGQLVKTQLPKAVHIQLLGASGQGKSRQATSILTQLCARNDPQHLQLALIDCEGETTAPFQALPHVRYQADEPKEAARAFRNLVNELERRDISRLAFPVILIFVEEFLNLRRTMPADYRDQALEDYTTLALRGRKRGMFLFSIGQTAYTEKAIRDAQNQFLSSMAFAVKPTAARSAGFTNTELLNKLYSDRRPGQFLLERPAGDAILLAPYVDTRIVPDLLYGIETSLETTTEEALPFETIEREVKASNNPPRNQLDAALQAKLAQVRSLMASGVVTKAEIIQVVWGVKPGNSDKYRQAEAEFKAIMAHIASLI